MLADAPRYEKVKKEKGKNRNGKKHKSVAGFFQSRLNNNTDES